MPPASAPRYRVEHAVLSDIGMRRANNQDSVLVLSGGDELKDRGSLFIVADGMGAHAAGELASKLAVDNVSHEYKKLRDLPAPSALRQAVQKANGLIHAKGQSSPEFQGMGTTCTSMVVIGDAAMVAHVGDSRVYRARNGKLHQLTFDHSLVWELAEASRTTADKVPSCIPKNVITRSLGPHSVVNVDLEGPFELQEGDTFLMCSDGLTGVVGDQLLGAVLGAMPPDDAVQTLVDLANLRGGPDNISIIVVRVGQAEPMGDSPEPEDKPDPVRWLAMAACLACLAVVVWCISEQQTWGAVLAAIGLGGAAVRALGRPPKQPLGDRHASLGGPFGNAPYRDFDCGDSEATTGALNAIIEELSRLRDRAAELNGAGRIDWQKFDEQRQQAAAAADWTQRVRSLAAAIRGLMKEVRAKPGLAEKALGVPTHDNALR